MSVMSPRPRTPSLSPSASRLTKSISRLLRLSTSWESEDLKLSKKRWIVLGIFTATSALNSIHWLQYSIITNITKNYYNVSAIWVNWSAMLFMLTYVPLILPAIYVIERKGLRFTLLFALAIMTFGAWLKLATLNRNFYFIVLICQACIGSAQLFILSVPPRLASIWFEAKLISTACAIGVFGNQCGFSLGFLIPSLVVSESDNMDFIRERFQWLYLGYAIPTSCLLVFAYFFFESSPKHPPNLAQLQIKQTKPLQETLRMPFIKSLKDLFKNKDFILLMFSYGINVGVLYTISTLLNQLYLLHYPHGQTDAGYIGFVMILGGVFGSVIWGILLDKTHKYKTITLIIYCLGFVSVSSFAVSLWCELYIPVYIFCGFIGFFMNGFLTVAYEFSSELTYPIMESTSSGILNGIGELLGLSMVYVGGIILSYFQDLYTNVFLASTLIVGFIISLFLNSKNLKRHMINTAVQ